VAPLTAATLLVVDDDADVQGTGHADGAVFLLETDSGAVSLLATQVSFANPAGAAFALDGRLYIADDDANPPGVSSSGTVWALELAGGAITTAYAGPPLVNPEGVAALPDGSILIADRDADPAGLGGDTGALFRFEPASRALTVAATSPLFRDPKGVYADGLGRVFVIDDDANPLNLPEDSGAVFQVDPASGAVSVLVAGPELDDPETMGMAADGTLLLVDDDSDPVGGSKSGALFGVSDTGALELLARGSPFKDLEDLALAADGQIYLLDDEANRRPGGGAGAIFRWSGSEAALVASGPPFTDLASLVSTLPVLGLASAATRLGPGQPLELLVRLANPGPALAVDVYLLLLGPAGTSRFVGPAGLTPAVSRLLSNLTLPAVWTLGSTSLGPLEVGDLPRGAYRAYLGLTRPGTFEILGLTSTGFALE
jgi:sugar lactone lactonase YvrE